MDLTKIHACDVLVVGSGIAGMAAAFEAASCGRRVLVVESEDEPGGASAISGGASCLVGTPVQEAAGVQDSVDLALEDWARAGGDSADLVWAKRYLAGSRAEVYDWTVSLGIGWSGPNRQENHTVARGHSPKGGGTAITRAVTAAALALGVEVVTSTRVTRLLTNDGVVVGAVLSRDGRDLQVSASAVLMATGGFVNNPEMLRAHAPMLQGVRRFLCGGAYQARGSGHEIMAAVNAQFTFLENIWVYPDGTPNPRDPLGQRGVLLRGPKTEIWVNERGERFYDERRTGGSTGGPALMAQPGQHCWAIFDHSTSQTCDLRDDSYYGLPQAPIRDRIAEFFATSAYVRRADTVEALAEMLALPSSRVVAEVAAFNQSIEDGSRDGLTFGRDPRGSNPIAEPPFYAVEYMPTVQKNLGGVRTDLSCRVLSTSDTAIPGLYAAGEVAGMAGGHINGKVAIENTMFAPCLFSGRVAGRSIAADLASGFATSGQVTAAPKVIASGR